MIYWYTPQNSKKSWHHPFRIHRYHRCIFHLNQRQWATPHPSTKNTQPVPRGCQCKALDLLLRQVLQPWVTLRCHSSYHSSYHFKYIYNIYICDYNHWSHFDQIIDQIMKINYRSRTHIWEFKLSFKLNLHHWSMLLLGDHCWKRVAFILGNVQMWQMHTNANKIQPS
jgi:hypothetical protein